MGAVAGFGSATGLAAATLIAAGVLLDILRYRTAPDLRLSADQIKSRLAAAATDEPTNIRARRSYLTYIAAIYILGTMYVAIILVASRILGEGRFSTYLLIVRPLSDASAPFFKIIGNHASDMSRHGYHFRSMLSGHIYAVTFWVYMFSIVFFSFRYVLSSAIAHFRWLAREGSRSDNQLKLRDEHRMIILFIVGVLSWGFASNISKLQYDSSTVGWGIAGSDVPFFVLYTMMVFSALTINQALTLALISKVKQKSTRH